MIPLRSAAADLAERMKRWNAPSPQPALGRRIPGTRTAHPYHLELRVPQSW
jgi:hypothetical protein